MLSWVILTLACTGYFLHEAFRAPVIEDDEPNGAPEAPPCHPGSTKADTRLGSHHEPTRSNPDK